MVRDKKEPDCYQCRWKAPTEDNHSKCIHPANRRLLGHLGPQSSASGTIDGMPLIYLIPTELRIKISKLGIKGGTFYYPFYFDPICIEQCSGFEEAKKDDPRVVNTALYQVS